MYILIDLWLYLYDIYGYEKMENWCVNIGAICLS